MSASNASCDSIKLFGKQRETALLAETAESDRLPHGIMLTGEKVIGKRTFAKWCAMLYLCREADAGAVGISYRANTQTLSMPRAKSTARKACVIMYALLQRSPMTATPVFSSMRTARK